MKIVIAPNAFKNSLAAEQAAQAIGEGLKRKFNEASLVYFPVADGGDGTGRLLGKHLQADQFQLDVHDPIGRLIGSDFFFVHERSIAIVELANASGLRLLDKQEYDPLGATTFGTGELIVEAISKGAKEIILCIGGSATVDGGTGIMRALGVRFINKEGVELISPESLIDLDRILIKNLPADVSIRIVCDVINPLLGPNGSAAVFAPQKGATDEMVQKLELSLAKLSDMIYQATGRDIGSIKHGGAAGGVAAGVAGILNAEIATGIDHFLDVTGFDRILTNASLVITGEGSLDRQTLHGKAPYGVALRARKAGARVIALAGMIPEEDRADLLNHFDQVININPPGEDLQSSILHTYQNLLNTAASIRI